jgi:hypothetical protein
VVGEEALAARLLYLKQVEEGERAEAGAMHDDAER